MPATVEGAAAGAAAFGSGFASGDVAGEAGAAGGETGPGLDCAKALALTRSSAIVHPEGPPPPKQRRVPIIGLGIPGNDKKVEKLALILRPLTLDSDIIPPLATIHGFLYFNLSHEMTQVPNSSLYLPDAVFLPSNDPLIFFEVHLGNAPQP